MSDKKDPPTDSTAQTQPPATRKSSAPDAGDAMQLSVEVKARRGVPAAEVAMTDGRLLIGRDEGDVRIDDLLVSRQHAAIELQGDDPVLCDLDSTNGTFLNGRLLIEPAPVEDGDDIRIGPTHLLVRVTR